MIAKFYGRSYTLQTLREKSFITREGVSMLGISDAAESIGIHTQGVRINSFVSNQFLWLADFYAKSL
jgi:ATP-binding cassette subfamily B protein